MSIQKQILFHMSTYVIPYAHICPRMWSHMPTYVHVCDPIRPHMSTYVIPYAHICPRMWSHSSHAGSTGFQSRRYTSLATRPGLKYCKLPMNIINTDESRQSSCFMVNTLFPPVCVASSPRQLLLPILRTSYLFWAFPLSINCYFLLFAPPLLSLHHVNQLLLPILWPLLLWVLSLSINSAPPLLSRTTPRQWVVSRSSRSKDDPAVRRWQRIGTEVSRTSMYRTGRT